MRAGEMDITLFANMCNTFCNLFSTFSPSPPPPLSSPPMDERACVRVDEIAQGVNGHVI